MNLRAVKNTAISILNPRKTGVIMKKIALRFMNDNGSLADQENKEWLKSKAISDQQWLEAEDKALWQLAEQRYQAFLDTDVERIKGKYPKEIHGPGGAYAMLYFLVRKYQPDYMVETGVSLGTSSHAILTAMEENGKGELYSSDFPYFRIKDAEKYIGLLVPENLKDRWHLYLDGDSKNLPMILQKIPKVDIFHYDSDKSVGGRQAAYDLVRPHMADNGLILFDDAHDNAHFYDLIHSRNLQNQSRVVTYHGKFIGVVDVKNREEN